VISPLGTGKEAFWQGLVEGRNGIEEIASFDTASFRSKKGGLVQGFNPKAFMMRASPSVRMSPQSVRGSSSAPGSAVWSVPRHFTGDRCCEGPETSIPSSSRTPCPMRQPVTPPLSSG
jgi:hypothetical protein